MLITHVPFVYHVTIEWSQVFLSNGALIAPYDLVIPAAECE